MELSNIGKKFVYSSIIMMLLSMVLPWESLEDYSYGESMGILMNIIPAFAFSCIIISIILNKKINLTFPFLCIVIAILFFVSEPFYFTIFGFSSFFGIPFILNFLIAVIFIFLAVVSFSNKFSIFLAQNGINYVFLLICLINGFILYIGMQYYPDTYTIGYLLFPSSVIVFMLGAIFSVKRIDGSQS